MTRAHVRFRSLRLDTFSGREGSQTHCRVNTTIGNKVFLLSRSIVSKSVDVALLNTDFTLRDVN